MVNLEKFKLRGNIEKYFENEQCFDKKIIYDMIELIIKSRKYNSLIDDINISDQSDEKGISGSYSPVEKNLNIVLPNNKNDFFDYNTTILHILLHELEHVGQHKKCLESKINNLEIDLLSKCFKANDFLETIQKRLHNNEIKTEEYITIIQQMEFYQMYSEIVNKGCYELLPSERQAEINSFKYLIELLKRVRNEQNNEKIEMISTNYLLRKIMGYKEDNGKIVAPTYELYKIILQFMNQSEHESYYFKTFDSLSKNMTLDQRLYYGLNISTEEYNNQKSEIGKRLTF